LHSLALDNEEIEFVCRLVEEAGRLAVTMRQGVEINTKDAPDDMVTAADFALSRLIVCALSERFSADQIISEEGEKPALQKAESRQWLIDPIDGTQNYINGDGQYCVMVGLLVDGAPAYGWVYAPATGKIYHGGPGFGAFAKAGAYEPCKPLSTRTSVRLLMGSRDRKAHPWVMDLSGVEIVKTGSVGLKVGLILDDLGDVFIHLSGKLKVWDTAGPAAIALGAGLEVGTAGGGALEFALPDVTQKSSVIMGRAGALAWCAKNLVGLTSSF
jgi:3'(2'), 5'-bisphosphate nucleotidase